MRGFFFNFVGSKQVDMRLEKIPFDQISAFSSTDVAYQLADQRLRPFYKYPVQLDSFREVINDKRAGKTNRNLLYEVIKKQYASFDLDMPGQLEELKNDSTFTVVTAHQPSLLTGPLYYVIKIASAIRLAERLNAEMEERIVPVFILGGEDHDFEEINHFNLFGKSIEWKSDASGGPVGKMPVDGLTDVLNELEGLIGNQENGQWILNTARLALENAQTYGAFMFQFTHALFKNSDLIMMNMDDPDLKAEFKTIIEDEVLHQKSFLTVLNTQKQLEQAGFSAQAYVRPINFFYIDAHGRNRIEQVGTQYEINGTDLVFSKEEMQLEIQTHPERFSPNVIMRPIYQEFILPNLAYIGGGGELAYWLERKDQFELFNLNFPMLIRRASLLWLDSGVLNQMAKLDLSVTDMFIAEDDLIKQWIKSHSQLEFDFTEETALIEKAYAILEAKTKTVDPTLAKSIAAEGVKQLKQFGQLSGRLMRTQKQKHEQSVNKVQKLKEKLFPNGGMQERHDNMISFYLKYGQTFIKELIQHMDPLQKEFYVLIDE